MGNQSQNIDYLVAFQFGFGAGAGFGTVQMHFESPIRPEYLPGIQEKIRQHMGQPTAVVTAFSKFEN